MNEIEIWGLIKSMRIPVRGSREHSRMCEWLPIIAPDALMRRGMSDGDRGAWVDRHRCIRRAQFLVTREITGPDGTARDTLRSCSIHVGNLCAESGISTVWPIDCPRPLTAAESLDERIAMAKEIEDLQVRLAVAQLEAELATRTQVQIKLEAKDPDRWLDELENSWAIANVRRDPGT